MFIKVLKSKIQQLVVSDSNLHYPGSISLPASLMKLASIRPFEAVHVNNRSNGHRIVTYALPNSSDTKVTLNGAASKLFNTGAEIHVLSFAYLDQAEPHEPLLVLTDQRNRLVSCGAYAIHDNRQ